eukprot:SAG22_NODE_231_length_14551_cov_22.298090_6_plen_185_part_00
MASPGYCRSTPRSEAKNWKCWSTDRTDRKERRCLSSKGSGTTTERQCLMTGAASGPLVIEGSVARTSVTRTTAARKGGKAANQTQGTRKKRTKAREGGKAANQTQGTGVQRTTAREGGKAANQTQGTGVQRTTAREGQTSQLLLTPRPSLTRVVLSVLGPERVHPLRKSRGARTVSLLQSSLLK